MDHNFTILDFIVDTANISFVSYSSSEILIYSSDIQSGVFIKF